MSVVVDWLVEDSVIIWESSGKVSGEEIANGSKRLSEMLKSVQERNLPDVHIFVDSYRADQAPMSIHAMKQWFTYLEVGGYDWHVICVSDPKIKVLASEFAHKFKIERLILVDDIIEGLRFLDTKLGRPEAEAYLLNHYRSWVRTAQAVAG